MRWRPQIAAALLALSCAGANPSARGTKPVGEDPLALLPAGADLLLDVDVTQLRAWDTGRRLWTMWRRAVPTLGAASVDPFDDVDTLQLALYDVGGKRQRAVWLVHAQAEPERFAGEGASPSDYRGLRLWETATVSVARVTPRLLVGGAADDVRRALDLARDYGDSVRAQKTLMAALARAPTAKSGRPAIIGAAVLNELLRDRMTRDDIPGNEAEWLSLALAVGDGLDAEIVATLRGPAEAQTLTQSAQARARAFGQRVTVRALGLEPLVKAFSARQKENEVFLVYRLAGRTLARMLDRLESLPAALARPAGGGQATPR